MAKQQLISVFKNHLKHKTALRQIVELIPLVN